MAVRIAVLAALAAVALWILPARPAAQPVKAQLATPPALPPMFSPSYREALRDVPKLEKAVAACLEQ